MLRPPKPDERGMSQVRAAVRLTDNILHFVGTARPGAVRLAADYNEQRQYELLTAPRGKPAPNVAAIASAAPTVLMSSKDIVEKAHPLRLPSMLARQRASERHAAFTMLTHEWTTHDVDDEESGVGTAGEAARVKPRVSFGDAMPPAVSAPTATKAASAQARGLDMVAGTRQARPVSASATRTGASGGATAAASAQPGGGGLRVKAPPAQPDATSARSLWRAGSPKRKKTARMRLKSMTAVVPDSPPPKQAELAVPAAAGVKRPSSAPPPRRRRSAHLTHIEELAQRIQADPVSLSATIANKSTNRVTKALRFHGSEAPMPAYSFDGSVKRFSHRHAPVIMDAALEQRPLSGYRMPDGSVSHGVRLPPFRKQPAPNLSDRAMSAHLEALATKEHQHAAMKHTESASRGLENLGRPLDDVLQCISIDSDEDEALAHAPQTLAPAVQTEGQARLVSNRTSARSPLLRLRSRRTGVSRMGVALAADLAPEVRELYTQESMATVRAATAGSASDVRLPIGAPPPAATSDPASGTQLDEAGTPRGFYVQCLSPVRDGQSHSGLPYDAARTGVHPRTTSTMDCNNTLPRAHSTGASMKVNCATVLAINLPVSAPHTPVAAVAATAATEQRDGDFLTTLYANAERTGSCSAPKPTKTPAHLFVQPGINEPVDEVEAELRREDPMTVEVQAATKFVAEWMVLHDRIMSGIGYFPSLEPALAVLRASTNYSDEIQKEAARMTSHVMRLERHARQRMLLGAAIARKDGDITGYEDEGADVLPKEVIAKLKLSLGRRQAALSGSVLSRSKRRAQSVDALRGKSRDQIAAESEAILKSMNELPAAHTLSFLPLLTLEEDRWVYADEGAPRDPVEPVYTNGGSLRMGPLNFSAIQARVFERVKASNPTLALTFAAFVHAVQVQVKRVMKARRAFGISAAAHVRQMERSIHKQVYELGFQRANKARVIEDVLRLPVSAMQRAPKNPISSRPMSMRKLARPASAPTARAKDRELVPLSHVDAQEAGGVNNSFCSDCEEGGSPVSHLSTLRMRLNRMASTAIRSEFEHVAVGSPFATAGRMQPSALHARAATFQRAEPGRPLSALSTPYAATRAPTSSGHSPYAAPPSGVPVLSRANSAAKLAAGLARTFTYRDLHELLHAEDEDGAIGLSSPMHAPNSLAAATASAVEDEVELDIEQNVDDSVHAPNAQAHIATLLHLSRHTLRNAEIMSRSMIPPSLFPESTRARVDTAPEYRGHTVNQGMPEELHYAVQLRAKKESLLQRLQLFDSYERVIDAVSVRKVNALSAIEHAFLRCLRAAMLDGLVLNSNNISTFLASVHRGVMEAPREQLKLDVVREAELESELLQSVVAKVSRQVEVFSHIARQHRAARDGSSTKQHGGQVADTMSGALNGALTNEHAGAAADARPRKAHRFSRIPKLLLDAAQKLKEEQARFEAAQARLTAEGVLREIEPVGVPQPRGGRAAAPPPLLAVPCDALDVDALADEGSRRDGKAPGSPRCDTSHCLPLHMTQCRPVATAAESSTGGTLTAALAPAQNAAAMAAAKRMSSSSRPLTAMRWAPRRSTRATSVRVPLFMESRASCLESMQHAHEVMRDSPSALARCVPAGATFLTDVDQVDAVYARQESRSPSRVMTARGTGVSVRSAALNSSFRPLSPDGHEHKEVLPHPASPPRATAVSVPRVAGLARKTLFIEARTPPVLAQQKAAFVATTKTGEVYELPPDAGSLADVFLMREEKAARRARLEWPITLYYPIRQLLKEIEWPATRYDAWLRYRNLVVPTETLALEAEAREVRRLTMMSAKESKHAKLQATISRSLENNARSKQLLVTRASNAWARLRQAIRDKPVWSKLKLTLLTTDW